MSSPIIAEDKVFFSSYDDVSVWTAIRLLFGNNDAEYKLRGTYYPEMRDTLIDSTRHFEVSKKGRFSFGYKSLQQRIEGYDERWAPIYGDGDPTIRFDSIRSSIAYDLIMKYRKVTV